jgi:hypothetical protein
LPGSTERKLFLSGSGLELNASNQECTVGKPVVTVWQEEHDMKKTFYILTIMLVVVSIFFTSQPGSAQPDKVIPTFTIVSVVPDDKVTIRTANFPPKRTFTVTMGKIHTMGVGGVIVGTTDTGIGGSIQATYSIPATLKGEALISIRLQEIKGKYYAYNWFANSSTPRPTTALSVATGSMPTVSGTYALTPGVNYLTISRSSPYIVYPYFGITSVVQDSSVSISASSLPLNKTFNVLMGPYGSYGLGGTQVATLNSESSSTHTGSFNIPANLKGLDRIAIRLQSSDNSYYAYNWFFNRSTGGGTTTITTTTNFSFTIQSVVKDTSVTILATDIPKNVEYEVLMGVYGTQGINGTTAGTAKSSSTGSYTATFIIPAGMKGQERIAIRFVGKDGSFAYNWFYNVGAGTQ